MTNNLALNARFILYMANTNKWSSRISLIVAVLILMGVALLGGMQYSLSISHERTVTITSLNLPKSNITEEVVVFGEVIYYTSGNCTSGPTTTSTNATSFILASNSTTFPFILKM